MIYRRIELYGSIQAGRQSSLCADKDPVLRMGGELGKGPYRGEAKAET